MNDHDTIVAPATALVRSAVAVIRIAGNRAVEIATIITGKRLNHQQAVPTTLHIQGKAVDFGVALYFALPHSLTGDDVIELQCHGSIPVVQQLLEEVCRLGARLARPGEFLERAFLNDKLDLVQAEAVADLIQSSTRAQAAACMESLRGVYSEQVLALRRVVIDVRVAFETHIDFSDQDITTIDTAELAQQLQQVKATCSDLHERTKIAFNVQKSKQLLLLGAPNVGKSSLFNRLCGEQRAIVTSIAGTTRDLLFAEVTIGSVPVVLVDSAGLHETAKDTIEEIGMARSLDTMASASILLWVISDGDDLQAACRQAYRFVAVTLRAKLIFVVNKCDNGKPFLRDTIRFAKSAHPVVYVSAQQNIGMEALEASVLENLQDVLQESGFSANYRHAHALQKADIHLNKACTYVDKQLDIAAEEIRRAQYALETVVGCYASEDLLGDIFSRFCIGK